MGGTGARGPPMEVEAMVIRSISEQLNGEKDTLAPSRPPPPMLREARSVVPLSAAAAAVSDGRCWLLDAARI